MFEREVEQGHQRSDDRRCARLRYMRCSEVGLHSRADVFRAFFVLAGRLMSVHRRFHLDFAGLWHLPERYYSTVVLTSYSLREGAIRPVCEKVLCNGEDPRVVSDGNRAFVLCREYVSGDRPRPEYKLILLPEGVEKKLVVPPTLAVGKNWQPFIKDGRLFAVHSFAPLTILEISEDGQLAIVHERSTEYWLIAQHDNYTMVRGGSNAIEWSGSIVGVGHLTATRDDHRPFVWEIGPSSQMRLSIPCQFLGLRAKGFNIIDPTSLFILDGRLNLGVCASEREWFFGQRFLDLLIELPFSDPRQLCDGASDELFHDLGAQLAHLPVSRTFIPTNMRHDVASSIVHRGVESQGQAGCLVYGPYKAIEDEDAYIAELTYLTVEGAGRRLAGRFEVTCFKDGDLEVLGAHHLTPTTCGDVGTATVRFSTRGHLGWLLETRVFVEDGVRLNALSIRVMDAAVRVLESSK